MQNHQSIIDDENELVITRQYMAGRSLPGLFPGASATLVPGFAGSSVLPASPYYYSQRNGSPTIPPNPIKNSDSQWFAILPHGKNSDWFTPT